MLWVRAGRQILVRPTLWATAWRQARRVTAPGWWRRPPFLPWPDRAYTSFRLETQYGSERPAPGDVITYLEWCRSTERERRRR